MRTHFKRVTAVSAALLLTIVGIAVYFSGISGQFLNDDLSQIVDNPPVHSIANIGEFFKGGTMYIEGQPYLTGAYYRPLMTTSFSTIYSTFGANPVPFHLLQLLLAILCSFMLFLIFRYFFNPGLSLVLALVFLVHPINSQSVFAIASLQEPLFMLFGLLAFWATLRYENKTPAYTLLTAALLFLSLLSKETGTLFVLAVLGYDLLINWGKWRRAITLLAFSLVAVAIYLALRMHATGSQFLHVAPIDSLDLAGRQMNVPAILMFYVTKFVFPISLAAYYNWVHPTFSARYFLLPLTVDLAVVAAIVWGAAALYRRHKANRYFVLYVYFALWLLAGLAVTLQIIPLDETVSETWFYFPMVGALGMIAATYEAFAPRPPRRWLIPAVVLIIAVLGVRTAIRGGDWSTQTTLNDADVTVSKEDFTAYSQIAYDEVGAGDLSDALADSQRAVQVFPDAQTYASLAFVLFEGGHYQQASYAAAKGLQYGNRIELYRLDALISLYCGNYAQTKALDLSGLKQFPTDGTIWLFTAVSEDDNGDNAGATTAISHSFKYGILDNPSYNTYAEYVYKNIAKRWAVSYPVDPSSL